jgi:hypothetical protein
MPGASNPKNGTGSRWFGRLSGVLVAGIAASIIFVLVPQFLFARRNLPSESSRILKIIALLLAVVVAWFCRVLYRYWQLDSRRLTHEQVGTHQLPTRLPRFLNGVVIVIAGPAAAVVFVLGPLVLLGRGHGSYLPMGIMFMLAPIIVLWMHAGLLLLLAVTASEVALIILNSESRRTKIEAAGAIGTCAVLFIWVNFGH